MTRRLETAAACLRELAQRLSYMPTLPGVDEDIAMLRRVADVIDAEEVEWFVAVYCVSRSDDGRTFGLVVHEPIGGMTDDEVCPRLFSREESAIAYARLWNTSVGRRVNAERQHTSFVAEVQRNRPSTHYVRGGDRGNEE